MRRTPIKESLHPRNRFRAGYDFEELSHCCPPLTGFVMENAYGNATIDYGDPEAVKTLNKALLQHAYGLRNWDLPPGYLCPAIPGRSDYLHHLADLLAADSNAEIPRGRYVAVLDIGVGANCIYPLIGSIEYGWRFVASDIDPVALDWARKLAASNSITADLVDFRQQSSTMQCFKGVIAPGEVFDFSMCNPPFHSSAEEAALGTGRRRRNLVGRNAAPRGLSFGGNSGELWCQGGELGFVRRMIKESADLSRRCLWFTTLVSKSAHLSRLHQALKDSTAVEVRTIEMAPGQKKSRILAWTFFRPEERRAWHRKVARA